MTHYTVSAERNDEAGVWVFQCEERPGAISQSHRLSEALPLMAEAIGFVAQTDPDTVEIDLVPVLPAGLEDEVRQARAAVASLEEQQLATIALSRQAADRLREAGLSDADTAVILGLATTTTSRTSSAAAGLSREAASLRAQLSNEKSATTGLRPQVRTQENRIGDLEGERSTADFVPAVSAAASTVDDDHLRTAEEELATVKDELEAAHRLNSTLTRELDQRGPAVLAPHISETVAELRALCKAFEDARPQDMTAQFYIHAFNQYDTVVHELLAAHAHAHADADGA